MVQRLPRPDDRHRVHARLRDVPPARQRLPPLQPQRGAVPAPDRRPLRDAQPAERQRPHAVRRHLLLGEPRPDPLGTAPARDGDEAPGRWESTKIGAGPIPIETDEGWLVIYHGVLTSCNGFVYSMGAALLDLDEPWRVIARPRDYLLSPQVPYEQVGDVPNVVFPCAALVDPADRSPDRLLRRRGHGRLHGARPPLRAPAVRALLTSRRSSPAGHPA